MDNGFDYPNDLCVQKALLRRLDAIEILQIRLDYDLKRLNSIQYSLCQIVQRTSHFSRQHMSPLLRLLHWITVKQRIKFKWCLLIFKVLKLGLPPYFSPYFVPNTCKIATRRSVPSRICSIVILYLLIEIHTSLNHTMIIVLPQVAHQSGIASLNMYGVVILCIRFGVN